MRPGPEPGLGLHGTMGGNDLCGAGVRSIGDRGIRIFEPTGEMTCAEPDTSMPQLTVERLIFRLGGPISLSLSPGEVVCISGPSGSGKTLLLRAIADLDDHEGQICLDGVDAVQLEGPQWRRAVGMLPAEVQWWAEQVHDHFPASRPVRLQALGLPTEALAWEVSRLSSGESHRLGLARLLGGSPRALLLDEPTARLDPASIQHVEAVIRDYAATMRAPVIWVSHDPAQIQRVASRHFRLEKGLLLEERCA